MKHYFRLLILYIISCTKIYVSCYPVNIPDKIVMIGDSNVIDFVRNFYKEVILVYKVPNFVMIVWNPSSYEIYKKYGIPVEYPSIQLSDKVSSTYIGRKDFTKKINDRFKILLELLRKNLTILSLDTDLYFFENPLNLLNHIDPKNDITFQTDFIYGSHTELNVGLMYIKPTIESIKLFKKVLKVEQIAQSDFEFVEQGMINLVISAKRIKNLKVGVFDILIFVNGCFYFRYFKQFVDDENEHKTIGFHNNYIIGGMGKKYRFKELGLWKIDDNEYYSSKTRKYIKYSSNIRYDYENVYEILMIYLIYLGKELNRTIIFPRFVNSKNNETYFSHFLYYWNLAYFEKAFGLNYRENISFLYYYHYIFLIFESIFIK